MKEVSKFKIGAKVKHCEIGIWRYGVFEGVSCQKHLGLAKFDPPSLIWPGGPEISDLVRLDELEEVKEPQKGSE